MPATISQNFDGMFAAILLPIAWCASTLTARDGCCFLPSSRSQLLVRWSSRSMVVFACYSRMGLAWRVRAPERLALLGTLFRWLLVIASLTGRLVVTRVLALCFLLKCAEFFSDSLELMNVHKPLFAVLPHALRSAVVCCAACRPC